MRWELVYSSTTDFLSETLGENKVGVGRKCEGDRKIEAKIQVPVIGTPREARGYPRGLIEGRLKKKQAPS